MCVIFWLSVGAVLLLPCFKWLVERRMQAKRRVTIIKRLGNL